MITWIFIYLMGVLLSMQPFYIQSGFPEFLKEDRLFRYWFYSCFVLPYIWFILFWTYAIIVGLVAIIIALVISLHDLIKKYRIL